MKMKMKNSLLAAALLVCAASGVTQAQSCASPIVIPGNVPPVGGGTVLGDTCAGTNQLGTLCGAFSSPENDVVYTFTIANPHTGTTFSLSNSTPGWNAGMVILAGSCGPGVSCADVADNAGAGAGEAIPIPANAGNYFLIVTSSPGAGGCGSFAINYGPLPVQLQKFSIE